MTSSYVPPPPLGRTSNPNPGFDLESQNARIRIQWIRGSNPRIRIQIRTALVLRQHSSQVLIFFSGPSGHLPSIMYLGYSSNVYLLYSSQINLEHDFMTVCPHRVCTIMAF